MIGLLKLQAIALVIGFMMDLCFGDPEWLPHPVRIIGKLITYLEKKIRKFLPQTPGGELTGGGVMVLLIFGITGLVTGGTLWMAYRIHPYCYIGVSAIICYQMLATKDLKVESMRVFKALEKADIEASRKAVARIVGRDTANLDESGIAKAAVETVAENTSDGVVAPLFYMAVGGALFGSLYKAVNTMDSMVGYKNESYLYFGRAAAKLDDFANFLPARISAYCMLIGSLLLKLDIKQAYFIFKRDRYCHASPNSAQTEAVMAGALRVQLAGDAYYFGKRCPKQTIGDADREITYKDIRTANELLYATAFVFFTVVILIYLCLW